MWINCRPRPRVRLRLELRIFGNHSTVMFRRMRQVKVAPREQADDE